jgi:hypothetical protein
MRAAKFIGQSIKWVLVYLLILVLIVFSAYYIQKAWIGNHNRLPNEKLSAAPKIILSPDQLYDLSGSEAYGGGDPYKLFDEKADPKVNNSIRPVTHPLPFRSPAIYFPEGKGLRIVIDLRAMHRLREVYWYDRSLEKDTIRLYTGSMNHWKEKILYETVGIPAGWDWKGFLINDSARFLMLRFNNASAVLTEMALYGTAIEKKVLPATRAFRQSAKKTLRAFAGTNSYDYVPAWLLKPFHQTRLYQPLSWYDTDTAHAYPNNSITLNRFQLTGAADIRNWVDSIRSNGNALWMTVFNDDKEKRLAAPGMDAENPMSYVRHANLFWNLAAVYGAEKIDTALLSVKERPRYSGLGLMNRFENGNEDDAYWTKAYLTPMEYFALSSADYDGHEGRLGKRCGIRNADSNCLLMTSGMVQLDTNRVKTLKFLCEQLRTDRKFIWQGGVQYHYYSNASANKQGLPTHGISPEADRMREKLARVRAFHDRELPGISLILGENGYDRSPQSWQSTPVVLGLDAEASQGIMIIRSMMAAFMAGFDGYNQYMIRDATNDATATGAYATSGMMGGPASGKIYKAWHYWNFFISLLGDYQPDSIISEMGNAFVYRLRHSRDTNKVAYYLVGSGADKMNKKFKLRLNKIENQFFVKYVITDQFKPLESKIISCGPCELEVDLLQYPTIILMHK